MKYQFSKDLLEAAAAVLKPQAAPVVEAEVEVEEGSSFDAYNKRKTVKEEEEQIDEVSKDLAKRYMKKAGKDRGKQIAQYQKNRDTDLDAAEKNRTTFAKRTDGIVRAKKIAKEEVQIGAEEQARLDAIAEELGLLERAPEGEEKSSRDKDNHIQVVAGKAAGGRHVDFKHDDGTTSKISPSKGREIMNKLSSMKPQEKAEHVKKLHASAKHL